MYGTLRGALAGRKVAFERDTFKATVAGRISGIGKTIRIKSIHVHYDLAVPTEAREATERALRLHPEGCPAHQSVKDAIPITWDATVRVGDQTIALRERGGGPCSLRHARVHDARKLGHHAVRLAVGAHEVARGQLRRP